MTRLDRVRPLLVCPACHGELDFAADFARCAGCPRDYPIHGNKIYFIDVPERTDALDTLKGRFKASFGEMYYTIGVDILAPVFPCNYRAEIERFLDPSKEVLVDAGSGNRRRHPDTICIDCFDYHEVDVVCDLEALPFRDDSVDGIMSIYSLEHVRAAPAVAVDMARCTRPGGVGMHVVPFLYPYHAAPGDYLRYTHEGLPALFPGWEVLRRINTGGPFTLAMTLWTELFSIVFSFGSARLKPWLYLFACAVSFPMKYLDIFFVRREAFLSLAPTLLAVVRKPGTVGDLH